LRNSFVPKREVAVKLPFHKLVSGETLALYEITIGEKGPIDEKALLARAGLSTFSWEAHGHYEGGKVNVTNFIWPYLHQFFNDSHGLKNYKRPLKIPFDRYQLCLKAINIG